MRRDGERDCLRLCTGLPLTPAPCPLQSEDRLMRQIIPSQHHSVVLDSLTKQPIDFFMRDGEVGILISKLQDTLVKLCILQYTTQDTTLST